MVTTPKNADEAAAMEAAAAKFRMQQAEEELAARRETVKPLRDFVESDAFQEIADKAQELMPAYAAIEGIDVHLRPLSRFMRNLREAVSNYAPPEAPAMEAPAEAPSDEG